MKSEGSKERPPNDFPKLNTVSVDEVHELKTGPSEKKLTVYDKSKEHLREAANFSAGITKANKKEAIMAGPQDCTA